MNLKRYCCILMFGVLSFGYVLPSEASTKKSVVATSTLESVVLQGATSTAPTTTIISQIDIEKRVREYFVDIPVMIEIARCESKFRQFTDSGAVLRGGGSGGMIGIFQFYEAIHSAPALALGYDLATVEGNLAYARHLYQQSGTRPWASCEPDMMLTAPVLTPAQKELQIKLLTKVVELLTELLKLEFVKSR